MISSVTLLTFLSVLASLEALALGFLGYYLFKFMAARQAEKDLLQQELQKNQEKSAQEISQAKNELVGYREREKAQKDKIDQQNLFIDEFYKRSKTEFQNLAQQILEQKTKSFSENAEKNLDLMLRPLKEKIGSFEKKVDETYQSESRERFALKTEVDRLMKLNEKVNFEANRLTQALRGDSKVQGDWGEVVLERVLEASGLRKGEEYLVQESYSNSERERLRPDVVIQVPGAKHLIVDSKVSLKSYEDWVRASTDNEPEEVRAVHLKGLTGSIRSHIEDLSEKHYSKLEGITSPDFVFLFVPIEPAYLLAMQTDPELISRAWKKGIAIVTATTLLASLRTVASIWKVEHQNRNAKEIAERAGKLYDKFVDFVEDLESIGKSLEKTQEHYSKARNKLSQGNGNLIGQTQKLQKLGASTTKQISRSVLEPNEREELEGPVAE